MPKLTEDQEDALLEKFRKERQKELSNLKAPKKDAAKKTVLGMMRDRLPAWKGRFKAKGQKLTGLSKGYIATEKQTNETFILKHFYKSRKGIAKGPAEAQALQDRQDAVRELLGSTMYQLLLYDRAPKEELVIPDKKNQNYIYVRSKFFTNAITFTQFFRAATTGHLKSNNKLQALEGFEKVNAACDLLGEIDYHGGNLMVQDGKTITKIDHGKSFAPQFTDFGSLVKAKHKAFTEFGYTNAIKDGNLNFSIDKYSRALNQMLDQYNEQQMEAIIDQKLDELKKAGFDPSGVAVYPIGKPGRYVNSFDELKQFHKDQMRNSVTIMRNVAQSAEVISKFSNMPNEFRNGGWLKTFATSEIQDPVAYAAHYNIKIEGQNALEWAYNNNYKIKLPAQLIKDTATEERWKKDTNGTWHKKKLVVARDSIKIQALGPIEYITRVNKQKGFILSQSEKEFLAKATNRNFRNLPRRSAPPTPATNSPATINKEATKKVPSQDQVNIDKLVILVGNFAKEAETSAVTTEKITLFYDTLLSNLEKQGYLTSKDVTNIKRDPDYAKQAEDTAKLINTNTLDIEVKEKIYYTTARFTKAIGLTYISEYCTKKTTTEKVKKMHAIEAALSHSVKRGIISNKSKPASYVERLEKVGDSMQEKLEARRAR